MAETPGKYSGLIRNIKKADTKPDIDTSDMTIEERRKTYDRGEMENLSVRVPKEWKRHWVIQSKVENVTLTDIMCRALADELGLPD